VSVINEMQIENSTKKIREIRKSVKSVVQTMYELHCGLEIKKYIYLYRNGAEAHLLYFNYQ